MPPLLAAGAETPFAALRDVGKHFSNGTLALKGVNLTIRQGEFIGLVGPSGCGKSTILKMLAGLASPSSGTVERPETAQSSDVGYVFQEATLMPWISAERNVMMPLRLGGMPKAAAARAARQALASVGLSDFVGAYPGELSGGMRMRVAIARAVVTRPRVLLLDEPFAALDEITRFNLNTDLLRLWAEHRFTAVFVTHSVSEAVFLSQRVFVMAPRPGRVIGEYSINVPAAERTADWRATVAYGEYLRAITQRLNQGMAQ